MDIIKQRITASFGSRAMTIRTRLLVITLVICAVAVIASAALAMIVNLAVQRDLAVRNIMINAETLALQSRAPLEFLDPVAATETYQTLVANPFIRKLCVYDSMGDYFASYISKSELALDSAASCPPQVGKPHVETNWDTVKLTQAIYRDKTFLGTMYIERSLDDLKAYMWEVLRYKLAIVIFVMLLIWPLSSFFRHRISEPIIQLAKLSRDFSQDRQVRVKAVKTSDDELGELADAFNAMTDEIARNEKQLERAIDELTQSNIELERFAHVCSHDLQEPLRMLSNYTTLLERKMDGKLDEDTKQYLYFISDGAIRMRELINDILAYARVQHQPEPMREEELGDIVRYVLQNLSASINDKNAQISVGDMPKLLCNRTLMVQIFQNLLSNALKFCKTEPRIQVSASHHSESASYWKISIKDNGIGIDLRYHDKIFEIFKRLNRREEFQGTGIGLAICKKAVEYHGGKIWMESKLGEGTNFFFTIPDDKIGGVENGNG